MQKFIVNDASGTASASGIKANSTALQSASGMISIGLNAYIAIRLLIHANNIGEFYDFSTQKLYNN